MNLLGTWTEGLPELVARGGGGYLHFIYPSQDSDLTLETAHGVVVGFYKIYIRFLTLSISTIIICLKYK